ncbi:MAG TPA: HAMP domain-containing sensor histidine kinase [Candidatus Binataceae bacterium]|nr:HAMP domain-containing sensor histidine kinase [Candidatus Binataceae bacterium]
MDTTLSHLSARPGNRTPNDWMEKLGSETLANLAHELRTPLQALLGLLDILRDDYAAQLDEDLRELVERMNVNAFDLSQTLTNLIAFVLSRTGNDSMVAESLTPSSVLADIRPALDAANLRKGLRLDFDLTAAPQSIRAPRRAITTIALNLALNAIKFTDRGSVTVSIRRLTVAANDLVEIAVADTGPGLDPKLLDQISQPFAQLSRSSTRTHRGLGLGLAVVRHYSSRLGGTLSLESRPGHGAIFIVRIPQSRDNLVEFRPARAADPDRPADTSPTKPCEAVHCRH